MQEFESAFKQAIAVLRTAESESMDFEAIRVVLHYRTFPLSDGLYNGFLSGFTDGVGEIYEGSGNWKPWRNQYADLQFYFELAE